MRIAAYELANRLGQQEDDGQGLTGISRKCGVSVESLNALLVDSSISPGNLAKLTSYLGLTQPAYYEYVEFAVNWLSMNRKLQQVGFVPGNNKEGVGALRWSSPSGQKVVRLYVCSYIKGGKSHITYNYAVSVEDISGSHVVVASDKTYHEACNIAYLQASVLGWEAK